MDGPRDYHTKWSKSERERQILHDITYTWNLNYDTSELIYETDSHTQGTDLWLPGRGDGEGCNGSLALADAITKLLLPDVIICTMDKQQ